MSSVVDIKMFILAIERCLKSVYEMKLFMVLLKVVERTLVSLRSKHSSTKIELSAFRVQA